MEHSQNNMLVTLLAALICACVTVAALPSGRSGSSGSAMDGDLSHLVKLIGKLKTLSSHRTGSGTRTSMAENWAALDSEDGAGSSAQSLNSDSAAVSGSGSVSASDKLAALKQGFLGFNKRQGAWSYDYGLGGGRFGKRYYGDYGIGGGRFGRDVDHVDIADTNDANL